MMCCNNEEVNGWIPLFQTDETEQGDPDRYISRRDSHQVIDEEKNKQICK